MRFRLTFCLALLVALACADSPGPASHVLSIDLAGTGSGSVLLTPPGVTCLADCTEDFTEGTEVTLTAAVTGELSSFAGWSGGGCSGTTPECIVTVNAATAVTATFVAQHTLTVEIAGLGRGAVTSSPAGIDCGTDCAQAFDQNTEVTLTAVADVGSTFAGWSGGGCSGTGTCVVTLNAAATVTATFTVDQHTLTVVRAGTGAGTVTSNPAGINCGGNCTEPYDFGAEVTLTASAATGSSFAGWSGGGCSGTGTCVVTMTAAFTVTATFNLTQHTLVVSKAGTGGGTVTSSPAGINCGGDCSELYNFGTVVTLTADAATGSIFSGWSGGGCSGVGTCTTTVTGATAITPTFTSLGFTVSSGWSCAIGVSCQDVYDLTLPASSRVTVAVASVSGASVVRLAAFSPGMALSGKNLMTGRSVDRRCGGQDASDAVTIRAVGAGVYRIAVARDWGASAGASGTYTLTVTTDKGIFAQAQTVNDASSGHASTQCGYTFTAAASWNCASGVSCQDVYDFETLAPTTVTVSVTAVTGFSVVRLAAFDGSSVSTTNRFNGRLTDRECAGQNDSDAATTPSLPLGQHRFAVGRDWGSSAGASGTYMVTITTSNVPLVEGGATLNDSPSAFGTTSCP